jgi:hypothetical protein
MTLLKFATIARRIASAEHVASAVVWWVLREKLLYLCQLQRRQGPTLKGYPERVAFFQLILLQCAGSITSLTYVLFTDAARRI